jgi:hypothetical protein
VEERGHVYESRVAFTQTTDGWNAVESDFALSGGLATNPLGDLTGAELRYTLDAEGKPVRVETSGKVPSLSSLSLFSFRAIAVAREVAGCEGTSWDSKWERDGRKYAYQYRVGSVHDGVAVLEVEGRTTTPVNEWDVSGQVEIALADGFAGKAALHVRGPGAPRVNDFDRRISIEPEGR